MERQVIVTSTLTTFFTAANFAALLAVAAWLAFEKLLLIYRRLRMRTGILMSGLLSTPRLNVLRQVVSISRAFFIRSFKYAGDCLSAYISRPIAGLTKHRPRPTAKREIVTESRKDTNGAEPFVACASPRSQVSIRGAEFDMQQYEKAMEDYKGHTIMLKQQLQSMKVTRRISLDEQVMFSAFSADGSHLACWLVNSNNHALPCPDTEYTVVLITRLHLGKSVSIICRR